MTSQLVADLPHPTYEFVETCNANPR